MSEIVTGSTALAVENKALRARIQQLEAALRMARQKCPEKKPPPAFDQWGDMIADNAERHADRVSDEIMWGIAEIIDAALEAKP
jgi:hypothetical protein